MNKTKLQTSHFRNESTFIRFHLRLVCVFCLLLFFSASVFFSIQNAAAQNQVKIQTLPSAPIRVGERLTYNISFEKFNDAAYAEIYAVSRGKLGERDAVELRGRLKTRDLVSAAFYLLDETRTTFASAVTGLPLYIRKVSNASVLPQETINNYTVTPTAYNDLLTLIYQARNSNGIGSFSLQEDDKIYNVSLQNIVSKKQNSVNERVKTDAGEFETNVSSVQSEFLVEKGITNLRINFSADQTHVPVLIRFETPKGDFRAELASIQVDEPEIPTIPTPVLIQAPRPTPTPKPIATPTQYIENAPLSADLPFSLGETLEYQVTNSGQMVGLVTLQAKERKQFQGQDSLFLTATVTETQPGQQVLFLNNGLKAQVNPDSLAPQQIELSFSGVLSAYNQKFLFDQKSGFVINNAANQIEIPVGTHSILSLAYAVRAFNLKPSKDPSNPVNDTRVAVFLDTKAYVFTLRPSNADLINLQGERVSAQLVSVSTGNPGIDQYNLRVWLSNDDKRTPLRLSFGNYQADLISEKQILPK
jgi:hypothetical protein